MPVDIAVDGASPTPIFILRLIFLILAYFLARVVAFFETEA